MSREYIENPKEVHRVQNEMAIFSSVQSPHIVRYIEHFIHEKNLYIVMELCVNKSLRNFLRRRLYLTLQVTKMPILFERHFKWCFIFTQSEFHSSWFETRQRALRFTHKVKNLRFRFSSLGKRPIVAIENPIRYSIIRGTGSLAAKRFFIRFRLTGGRCDSMFHAFWRLPLQGAYKIETIRSNWSKRTCQVSKTIPTSAVLWLEWMYFSQKMFKFNF